MTYKEYFEGKTDEELQAEYLGLDQVINEIGCFGTRDLIMHDKIAEELCDRGYQIQTSHKIAFHKEEAEVTD